MAIIQNRTYGKDYTDNIANPVLGFNNSETWTVTGTGSAVLDLNTVFEGLKSLKIENTAPSTDLIVTNSAHDTTIAYSSDYNISFYLYKDEADEFFEFDLEVFKDATLLDTQSFTLGSETTEDDLNDLWIRFMCPVSYRFSKADAITFRFTLKGKAGTSLTSTTIYVDGFMISEAKRVSKIPPIFNPTVLINKEIASEAEPTVSDNNFKAWLAESSGTKDGTVYEQGDVLLTVNSLGTSKTIILADFSAL